MAKDFLAELIEERTRRNPKFPDLVAEATRRRELASHLVKRREALGLSQTVVAARMGTAASVVSKLEGGSDVKVSTLQRYCTAVGGDFSLVVRDGVLDRPWRKSRKSRPKVKLRGPSRA
jgi:transcriptional regulator with XRE-family HTH domain